jgi:hypothetical protein
MSCYGFENLKIFLFVPCYDDYSKAVSGCFDPIKKARRREEIFPKDCEKAFELGARFAQSVR